MSVRVILLAVAIAGVSASTAAAQSRRYCPTHGWNCPFDTSPEQLPSQSDIRREQERLRRLAEQQRLAEQREERRIREERTRRIHAAIDSGIRTLQTMPKRSPSALEFKPVQGPLVDPKDLKRNERKLSFKMLDVPPPAGHYSIDKDKIQALSDKELQTRIARTRKALERFGENTAADVDRIRNCVDDLQDAEQEAINASLDLLKSGLTKNLIKRVGKRDQELAESLEFLFDQVDNGLKIVDLLRDEGHSSLDRQAKLKEAHRILQTAYEQFADNDSIQQYFSRGGPQATALVAFVADYGYEATRWNASRRHLDNLIDNVEKKGGVLHAGNALKDLNTALHEEMARRRSDEKRLE